MNYYGQIDLTKLGIIARKHPELVKKVMFKDGEHMVLNMNIFSLNQPDKFGNTATMKVSCKKDEQVEGVSYYIGNLKNGESQQTQQSPAPEEQDYYIPPQNPENLPF